MKRIAILTLTALLFCAALFFVVRGGRENKRAAAPNFVTTNGSQFFINGQPFRFVGANVAVMYGDDERKHMPETLRAAAGDGVRVIRVWASGEAHKHGAKADGPGSGEWLHANPFRRGPEAWNEEAFIHLDRVITEAARNNLRVQICLTNWWPDTGGVTQYLRWAGINDAYDKTHPYSVNVERAMEFYTNERARELYRQHVEKIVTRRNSITGLLYKDDPTILSYELMNEAQAPTLRWAERRAWVAEMSAYIKSLDPNHLVTPGTWGYRNAVERRAWLEEQRLPNIDYCDIHVYPRDDHDSYIDSPEALREFIDNRAAAAFSINKPLIFGEFGITPEGFKGVSQERWFRSYFENVLRAGASGALVWIWTHVPEREYGIAYTTSRDDKVRAEFKRASELFASQQNLKPPTQLLNSEAHLIPRQFVFERAANDPATRPAIKELNSDRTVYRFAPGQATRGRFERLGSGQGYVWGAGVGFFEYITPAWDEWRRVKEIIVRAHLQPTLPHDGNGRVKATRITLFINNTNCGSQLVSVENRAEPLVQEWHVDAWSPRLDASLGRPLSIRFTVEPTADQPYGLNISNFPPSHDPDGKSGVEIEIGR